MYINIIIETKNSSISVRTLHNLLNINNIAVIQNNVQIELTFVNDNPFEKTKTLMKKMKTSDRILCIDYGISMDPESVKKIFEPFPQGYNCLVFPCVEEGVDWDMFKNKVKNNVKEPTHQMGLNFDTKVSRKISDDLYKVSETNPKVWLIDSKQVLKKLKGKNKNETLKIPAQTSEIFEKFNEKGINVFAFVDAKICKTYQHECFSNILEAAGVNKE